MKKEILYKILKNIEFNKDLKGKLSLCSEHKFGVENAFNKSGCKLLEQSSKLNWHSSLDRAISYR